MNPGEGTGTEVNRAKGTGRERIFVRKGYYLVEMVLVVGLDSQLNLLIINQYMRNTLNAYDRNPNSEAKKYKIPCQRAISARTSIVLAIILLCLQVADCRETVLVESLRSKNDKIMLKMLEQTHNYI